MRMRITTCRSLLISLAIFLALTAKNVEAQQPAGQNSNGNYTVTSTAEAGIRGITIDGNADKYRSDQNYQPGFRLFESSLLMRSNDNNGMLFDTLLINSQGWGGDPTGYFKVNADKTKYYRFDANFRKAAYFNSLRNFALNQHTYNTDHKFGDFDLTLMPQNQNVRITLGYSLDRVNGDSATTYDFARDEFPVFAPVRTEANEYRIGVEGKVWVFDYSALQGFRHYKEDTTYLIDNPTVGNNPINFSRIDTLQRDFPTRGRMPFTRLSLHTLLGNRVDITGRYIYSSAKTDYTLFERLTGQDSSGNTINSDSVAAFGSVSRPNNRADLGVTVFVTDRLKISDTVSVNTFQINGAQSLAEVILTSRNGVPRVPVFLNQLDFTLTTYRRAENTIELDYEFHPRFSAHIGHRYTDRRVKVGALVQPPVGTLEPESFDNRTNTILWGGRGKLANIWTVYFDMERGSADNVFTRVDNYEFTNIRARSIIRPTRSLTINTSLLTRDNNNPSITDDIPPRGFGSDINTRIYTASADWTRGGKFSLGGGYTYTHLTSEAEIIFFFNSVRTEGLSRYFVRHHQAFANTNIQIAPRATLFAAYSFNKDSGQKDRVTLLPDEFITSYPVQYQSADVRFSLRLNRWMDWVAGYQRYDFQERFVNLQHYDAHMPFTSLKFYFGERSRL